MNEKTVSKLDGQVRKLLQFIVSELPGSEPDWFLDKNTVCGRIYAESVHLLHAEANPWPAEEDEL